MKLKQKFKAVLVHQATATGQNQVFDVRPGNERRHVNQVGILVRAEPTTYSSVDTYSALAN